MDRVPTVRYHTVYADVVFPLNESSDDPADVKHTSPVDSKLGGSSTVYAALGFHRKDEITDIAPQVGDFSAYDTPATTDRTLDLSAANKGNPVIVAQPDSTYLQPFIPGPLPNLPPRPPTLVLVDPSQHTYANTGMPLTQGLPSVPPRKVSTGSLPAANTFNNHFNYGATVLESPASLPPRRDSANAQPPVVHTYERVDYGRMKNGNEETDYGWGKVTHPSTDYETLPAHADNNAAATNPTGTAAPIENGYDPETIRGLRETKANSRDRAGSERSEEFGFSTPSQPGPATAARSASSSPSKKIVIVAANHFFSLSLPYPCIPLLHYDLKKVGHPYSSDDLVGMIDRKKDENLATLVDSLSYNRLIDSTEASKKSPPVEMLYSIVNALALFLIKHHLSDELGIYYRIDKEFHFEILYGPLTKKNGSIIPGEFNKTSDQFSTIAELAKRCKMKNVTDRLVYKMGGCRTLRLDLRPLFLNQSLSSGSSASSFLSLSSDPTTNGQGSSLPSRSAEAAKQDTTLSLPFAELKPILVSEFFFGFRLPYPCVSFLYYDAEKLPKPFSIPILQGAVNKKKEETLETLVRLLSEWNVIRIADESKKSTPVQTIYSVIHSLAMCLIANCLPTHKKLGVFYRINDDFYLEVLYGPVMKINGSMIPKKFTKKNAEFHLMAELVKKCGMKNLKVRDVYKEGGCRTFRVDLQPLFPKESQKK